MGTVTATTTPKYTRHFTPAVGRRVHYMSHGTPGGEYPSTCRAAIITAIHPAEETDNGVALMDLCILNPEGMFFNLGVRQDEAHTGGTWHIPENL